jgi:putative resolvase
MVANSEAMGPHEELIQDLLSIIQCFSCRLDGLRAYKDKVRKIIENVDPCQK